MSNEQLAMSNDSQPRKMKYSGVEWIGDIPEEWETSTINTLYSARNEKVSDSDYPPLSVTMKGIVPQLETAAKTDAHDSRKLVKKGDFAINSRSDRRGSCGISDYDGSVSLINTVLQPREEMNPVYYNWLFHSSRFSDEFYRWGHGIVDDLWTTRWQEMRNITIPSPTLSEQQTIAEILDRKCTQIDALIANEEQQIAKLKAYKQSVITETVTKGLNPDVPMKDSGVEWIGEIPESWSIVPLKSLFFFKKGLPITKENLIESGIPVISYGQIHAKWNTGVTIHQELKRFVSETYITSNPNSIVKSGDFIMADTSEDLDGCGNCAYVDTDEILFAGYHTILLSSYERSNNKYLAYLFLTDAWRSQIRKSVTGVKLFSISRRILGKISVLLPDNSTEIESFLDQKCEQIDRLIAIKQQKIEKIQQYKKSVIYEYVTGKRESVDTNVVFFNPLTAKALLLCKIIDFLGDQLRGRIQALKCLFLIEDCVGINFNTQYFRFKHGPYTPEIVNIEKCCMENEWLTVSIVNNHYEYHIGNNHCYYSDKYDKIFGTNNSEIEKVLSFIKGMKTSEVERVATLFAVWNDMIIAGTNSPSDSEIIFEVRNNWTPNKANSPVSTWQNTLDKMRKAGITPKGYGLHTMKKENENEQL